MHRLRRLIQAAIEGRGAIGPITVGVTVAIAAADLAVADASLGILYVIPVILASLGLSRGGTLVLSAAAAVLREALGPMPWSDDAPTRIALGVAVFALSGLFVSELARNQRLAIQHLALVEAGAQLQRETEAELRQLLESSPGAMLTVGPDGRILAANCAAMELLGSGRESLSGQQVARYLPMMARLPSSVSEMGLIRTMVEGSARRASGESFFAQVWLSSYQTANGPRIAVVFSDATEVLRDREEMGLRQLLRSSRIVAAAVSHEVRNLSNSAYRLVREMGSDAGLAGREDFQAVCSLLDGMRKLSARELKPAVEEARAGADLNRVLQEFLLILDPGLREANVELVWEVPADLPAVRADHSGLLQVFLNLAQNAERALREVAERRLAIEAYQSDVTVFVRFRNNGRPVESIDELFQPLPPKATATGLGLFVSRAILRTYGGELQCVPQDYGALFVIQLPVADRANRRVHA
jgi:two-component system sensor kinase FixL